MKRFVIFALLLIFTAAGFTGCGNGAGEEWDPQLEQHYISTYGEDVWEKVQQYPIGSTCTMGTYEQDGITESGSEEIQWIVLDRQETKLLLISQYILENLTYHTEDAHVNWQTCDLNGWLNDRFYETAFTPEEQKQICDGEIFLLTEAEALSYFPTESQRQCIATAYAREGAFSDMGENWWWWLRSDETDRGAPRIDTDGTVAQEPAVVNGNQGVRPAFWLELNVEK